MIQTPQQVTRSVRELMDLSGRRALVTGAAGYVGTVVCDTLVELGATVVVSDVEMSACEERVRRLSSARPDAASAITCDLSDEQATRQMARRVIGEPEGLDILIHCAAYVGTMRAVGWAVPFDQQTVNAWDTAMRVNLTAAFILAQESREALAVSGRGSIILFSSIYGMVGPDLRLYQGTPMANPAGYNASKGGLLQLTRYLSTVLAPAIRVNAISPGGIWRGQPELFHERYVSKTPLGRMATEEDLKGAVAYLAGDLSSYVTGHNLVVDGGWSAW